MVGLCLHVLRSGGAIAPLTPPVPSLENHNICVYWSIQCVSPRAYFTRKISSLDIKFGKVWFIMTIMSLSMHLICKTVNSVVITVKLHVTKYRLNWIEPYCLGLLCASELLCYHYTMLCILSNYTYSKFSNNKSDFGMINGSQLHYSHRQEYRL